MNCAVEGCLQASVGASKYCETHRQEAHKRWVEMIKSKAQEKVNREDHFAQIWKEAIEAGRVAASKHVPTPMVVQQHSNMMDDNSSVEKQWVVEGGVCGFASVYVHPGTSSFARWATKKHGASKRYYGGVTVYHVGEYGQSMELKTAFASGFGGVLHKYGINAYVDSRMD